MKNKPNAVYMRKYDQVLFMESLVSLFWAVIKERRKSGKFPLQKIADATGIDKAKISRDFSGAPNWRATTISDIGNSLGVDLEVRARDRETGAIITASGPVDAVALSRKAGNHDLKRIVRSGIFHCSRVPMW